MSISPQSNGSRSRSLNIGRAHGLIAAILMISSAVPAAFAANAANEAPLEVAAVEGLKPEVLGVSAGGEVVWLSLRRYPADGMVRTERSEGVVADADGDGAVALDALQVATRQLIVAVDFVSSRVSLSRSLDLGAATTEADPAGTLSEGTTEIEFDGSAIEGYVLRRGVAVSRFAAADGGPLDLDGMFDGRVLVNLAESETVVGSGDYRDGLAAEDVVVVVDSHTLEVAVFVVGGRS